MPTRFGNAAAVMARALQLASRGIGSVEPNPPVGAVLVDDDLNLIAEGWHQRFGGPHAEIEAIAQAGERARGSTLFVTLEPCCHQGKTGPCTEAIAGAGIRNVVVALGDPFPEVDGKGIARLESLGIEVELGLDSKAAEKLCAPVYKTGHNWPTVGSRQMGDEPRRQNRHAFRRFTLDFQRAIAGDRASVAWSDGCDPRRNGNRSP